MRSLDAGLIAAGQAIEHYEISRYGTLRTWAQQLGMRDTQRIGILRSHPILGGLHHQYVRI